MTYSEYIQKLEQRYERKNKEFQNNAHELYNEFGLSSYLIRISDKMNRYNFLNTNSHVIRTDKSIIENASDIAIYCMMAASDVSQNNIYEEFLKILDFERTEKLFISFDSTYVEPENKNIKNVIYDIISVQDHLNLVEDILIETASWFSINAFRKINIREKKRDELFRFEDKNSTIDDEFEYRSKNINDENE